MLAAAPALETDPESFAARFAAHAAHGELLPQPEGSPLMEFVVAGLALYLFDRTGPYTARPGPAQVVIHGVLEGCEVVHDAAPSLQVVGVSQLTGVGEVRAVDSRHTVIVHVAEGAGPLPLVLSGFAPLPRVQVGDLLAFTTQPPLHGFLVMSPPADLASARG